MGFGSLSSLWFALALPAIVLLYILKRKYIDTPVSSHLLWNRVLREMEANRPWQRLRSRLLMLIQLLAAALVVLALMNPWIASNRNDGEHVVVILDRSASMSAATTANASETQLGAAKARLLEWLDDAGSGAEITLLLMGEEPEVTVTRETDPQAIRSALDQVDPAYGPTAYAEALSLASALTQGDPAASIRLFTDGQIPESLTSIALTAPVTVDQGAPPQGNAAVSQFGVKRSGQTEGAAAAVASFKSWGTEPMSLNVSLYAEEELAEVRTLSLEPGTPASLTFDGLPFADWYKLEATAAGDILPADNVSYAFLEGARPKRVLVVGEGNLFLEKALQLAGSEITRLAPEGVGAWAGSYRESDGPDAIIIDGAIDAEAANEAWSRIRSTKPVLQFRSGYQGEEQTAAAGPYEVQEHPVTRYLTFGATHIAGILAPAEGTLDGKPIVTTRDGAPLLLAGTENGQPRLWLTFALQHTDWPLRSEFPVFVHQALEWLTSAQGGSLGRAVAGTQTEIAFAPLAASARWISDESGEEQRVEKVDGRLPAMQQLPAQPGLYRLVEADDAGQTVQSRWLGILPDPRESAIITADPAFNTVAQSPEQAASATNAPQSTSELWRWIVLLVLAVVVWEWGVYRRGTSV